MDNLRKTVVCWREYYESSNQAFNTADPGRPTPKREGKRVQGAKVWQRGYLLELLLNFPETDEENEDEIRGQLISLYR